MFFLVVKILCLGIYTKSMHQTGFNKDVEFLNVVLLEMGIVYKQKNLACFCEICGAGRSRTAVQTSNKNAFYMLILWLVFESAPDKDTQSKP